MVAAAGTPAPAGLAARRFPAASCAWKILPQEAVPVEVEKAMIARFRADHGKPPFANNTHLLGR